MPRSPELQKPYACFGRAGRMLQRERPTGVACSACLSRSVTVRGEKFGYVLQIEILLERFSGLSWSVTTRREKLGLVLQIEMFEDGPSVCLDL